MERNFDLVFEFSSTGPSWSWCRPRFWDIFGLGPVRSEIFKNVLVLVRPGPGFLILFGPGPGLLGPNGFGPWISEGDCLLESVFLLGPSPENSRKLHGIANFRHSQAKLQTFSALKMNSLVQLFL